jgi:hypothetical protein
MKLPRFSFGKKKSPTPKEDAIRSLIQNELQTYVTKEHLEKYLKEIESNREIRQKWNGMSNMKKLKLLRYLANRKGGQ